MIAVELTGQRSLPRHGATPRHAKKTCSGGPLPTPKYGMGAPAGLKGGDGFQYVGTRITNIKTK